MKDLKELGKLFKQNQILIAITLVTMIVGAILGVITYNNG